MQVQWLGTASLLVTAGGTPLLFDPFVSLNPALPAARADCFPGDGEVLITHAHFDHLYSVPDILAPGGRVFCSACAAALLAARGVDDAQVEVVAPNDWFRAGEASVRVFKGRHIRFDARLVLSTLFSRRLWTYRDNLRWIAAQNRVFRERGETVVYEVSAEGKQVLVLGSLALADGVDYPQAADLLVLPYQGSSDLVSHALAVTARTRPKKILLDHFDDSFLPVSSAVDPQPFVAAMARQYPEIPVVVPRYGESYTV